MTSLARRLSAVTLGHVWSLLWRGLAWSLAVIIAAMLLDLDWSWRLIALLIFSDFASFAFFQYARPSPDS